MSWKEHFKCQVNFTAKGKSDTWRAELPIPENIPLKLLLINHSDFSQISKTSKRNLSLEHRKALWVYQNTHPSLWEELVVQFTQWMEDHSLEGAIELDVHQAATPVVLKFLSQTKLKVKMNVRVHGAPLAWLESEFAKPRKKNISLRQISSPQCLWAATPQLIGKLAA